MSAFRAAVVQAAGVGFDLERGLDKVARLACEASEGGASLALFPEAFLPGYPRGITFGTVVGDRTAEGREHFRRYFEASGDVPGPGGDRLVGSGADSGRDLGSGGGGRDGGRVYGTGVGGGPGGERGKERGGWR